MFTGRNPAALTTLPEMIPVRPKQALTRGMFKKLLLVLPEPTHGLALTAALTSMNIAEICGLRWRYVNLSNKWETVDGEGLPPFTIAVRWQWAHGEYGTVKRNSRKRTVPMVRMLVSYLTELKKRATFTGPDDPVFVGRTGKPADQHNEFSRKLKPIAESLGMPWVGWHTFRRTHTTLADQHAMSMSDRMAMMGHGSAAMTMHYTDEDMERRRQVLEQIAETLTALDTETLQ
jgi:integrase